MPVSISKDVWNNYPYILVNWNRKRRLKSYSWKHAILDSGVEIFLKGAKDYPPGFFLRYEFKAQQLTEIYGERIWVVIPDYPDDYRNNPIPHNVERTLRNIKYFHKVKGVNWIYPLQCDYLNLQSFHNSCHQVMKYQPERVAIGTVCKTQDLDFIEKCCIMARKHFPNAWIHAFGLTLKAVPRILPFIDSWDSCAYFTSREEHGFMCKTQKQRTEYFLAYLRRVNKVLHDFYCQKTLSEWF